MNFVSVNSQTKTAKQDNFKLLGLMAYHILLTLKNNHCLDYIFSNMYALFDMQCGSFVYYLHIISIMDMIMYKYSNKVS